MLDQVSYRRDFQFGGVTLSIKSHWAPASAALSEVLQRYEGSTGANPNLEISIGDRAPRHTGEGWTTRYGRFLGAAWNPSPVWRLELGPVRHIGRLVRPFINPAGHAIGNDVATILHERAFTTFVQLLHGYERSFVHGAMMVSPGGHGVLISGAGGVGKTSLALELGMNHQYAFLADDLLVLDTSGLAHHNATHPRIYAYNVLGDPDLERLLMKEARWNSRLNWYAKKHWPDRARIHVDPLVLYPSVAVTSRVDTVLYVERAEVPSLESGNLTPDRAGHLMAETMWHEIRGHRHAVSEWVESQGEGHRGRLTWSTATWAATISSALQQAEIIALRVPRAMTALDYRSAASNLLRGMGLT